MHGYQQVTLSVPLRDAGGGTPVEWDDGAAVWTRVEGDRTVIEANAAGLRSLARTLLTLAAAGVPDGTHVHLFDLTGLQPGSAELVLERREDVPSDAAPGV